MLNRVTPNEKRSSDCADGNEDEHREFGQRGCGCEGTLKLFGQEHSRFFDVLTVGFRMLSQHSSLFVFGQKVINQYHHEPQNDNDEPRPKDGEANTRNAKTQVLGMPYPAIQSFQNSPSSKKLV